MDIAEKVERVRSKPGELAGQVAVVTGAAKGLGEMPSPAAKASLKFSHARSSRG